MKRVVYIEGVLDTEKYVLKKEYGNVGIYERMTPTGYRVHQDWLLATDSKKIQIQSYNCMCYDEILDAIDSFNDTGKFGFKVLECKDYYCVHNSGRIYI